MMPPVWQSNGWVSVSTTPKRALLLFNPKSGRGPSPLPAFIAALGELGWQVEARELPKRGELAPLLKDAPSYQVIIAAGGDGTVSSVAYAMKESGVPLLAYPAGTANLIAHNLLLPEDPAALARIVDTGRSVQLDLGEVLVNQSRHGFVLLAGTGADAAMIRDSEPLKDKIGTLAYVLSAVKQLSPRATTFELELDGEARTVEAMAVMVANFGRANFRLPLAQGISPSDGLLTVLMLRPGTVFDLVPNLLDALRVKLRLGEPIFAKNLETATARVVKVSSAVPFPLQYDGEMHQETTPFEARVLPGAVHFLTPASRDELNT